MEDVMFVLRILVLSEDQIDPMMQCLANNVAFQSCSEGQHQFISIFSPARQLDIPNIGATLLLAELNIGDIFEKSREVVKLRNALFDIRGIGLIG